MSGQIPDQKKRRGLLAGGNWLVDHVKIIDQWPAQDTLAIISAQSDGNGGGAGTQPAQLESQARSTARPQPNLDCGGRAQRRHRFGVRKRRGASLPAAVQNNLPRT